MGETVELGVQLLASAEEDELDLSVAVDRLETVTREPRVTRSILDEAEKRGVIERSNGLLRVRQGPQNSAHTEIVMRDGEYTCRRCNSSISPGYFLDLTGSLYGAFGPKCIQVVTGRDEE